MIAKWHKSPVLVSFDAEEVHISDIPFPSVTVCNYNKVRKSRWEGVKAGLVSDPTNGDLLAEKEIAEQVHSVRFIRYNNGHIYISPL